MLTTKIHQQSSTWESQVHTRSLLRGIACVGLHKDPFLETAADEGKGRFGNLGIQLNCMDWRHMVNPPRDFVEFEFLISSRLFPKTMLNFETRNIIKIIES